MKAVFLLLVCVTVCAVLGVCNCGGGNLRRNFYKKSCPLAEDFVQKVTWKHTSTNPILPAKFLRMHFHDCFVRGCDGSILLNSTSNSKAEKDAIPNLSLTGFDVIDDIKAQLETECPGVVSCADILALATKDSVSFQFQNKKPIWEVLTGRRDGIVSLETEALANLPSPFSNYTTLQKSFASKGLNIHDLVVLSGGHTIGLGHCNLFSNRLYNFTGKGDQDPSLDPTYAAFLKTKCKNLADISTVEMDPKSSRNFDADYFVALQQKKGLFQSDAALLTNKGASKIVNELVTSTAFFKEFGQSMKKMGAIGVLTGKLGEIRKKCSVIN